MFRLDYSQFRQPAAPARPLQLAARTRGVLWTLLALLLALRLVAIVVIPLTDTSEARYGEIARKMVETGDWITPQFAYGIPFWAKPPLSMWLSALGIDAFGVNEFAVRLPSLLLAIAMLALVWRWVATRRQRDQALLSVAVLSSLVLFFAAAGAVMTDISLALCTTLTMIAFWHAFNDNDRRWGYAFFVGLGFGLLAKGPLVGVITLLPVVPWLFLRRGWRRTWQCLPWLGGSLLMLAIALPWYALAEHKTPGFLRYFIIGEHIDRFLYPHWHGDKYGNAHVEPIGMIWVYWLGAAFPFSFLALGWSALNARRLPALLRDDDGWALYLLLWSGVLLLFFTFARNIIWTYPLATLPALACLVVEIARRARQRAPWSAYVFVGACIVSLVGGAWYTALYLDDSTAVKSSQRDLVAQWLRLRGDADSRLVYYRNRYYSAEFYSHGRATVRMTMTELEPLLHNDTRDFIALKDKHLKQLTPPLRAGFRAVGHYDDVTLLAEITDRPHAAPLHPDVAPR